MSAALHCEACLDERTFNTAREAEAHEWSYHNGAQTCFYVEQDEDEEHGQ